MRFSVPLIFLAAASSIFAAPVPAPSESVIPSNDFIDVPTATGSYATPSASSSELASTSQEKSFLGSLLGEAISTASQVFGSSKRDLGEDNQISSSSSPSLAYASGVSSGIPTASSVTVATDDAQSKKSWLSGLATGISVLGSVGSVVSGLLGSSSSSSSDSSSSNSSSKKRDLIPSASVSSASSTISDLSSATVSVSVDSGIPTVSSVTVAADDAQSKKSWLSGIATGISVLGSVGSAVSGLLGSSSSSNSNSSSSSKKRDVDSTVSAASPAVSSGVPTASSVTVAADDVQSKKSWLSGIATGISVLGSVGSVVSGLLGSSSSSSSDSSNSSSNSKRDYAAANFAVPSVDIPQPSYIAVTFTA
ncbi:unnamed protein product [Ambrosiozyma monospora]|uniref:Unnamed protein product n=1 Tax=Ambrosiozyma monospora TaxID=43982 RepID=A0ACB5T5B5_AMBMO|nr:unnamed protein product [Ambrosiozyma monospora]